MTDQGATAGHRCPRCDVETEYVVTQKWGDASLGETVDWRRCPECFAVYFPPREDPDDD